MTIKLTYDYVKSNIENAGYQLLSTKYKDVKTKLQLKCPKNHIIEISYNKFQSGRRCAVCNKGIRLTYEYVKSWIENPDLGGYKLLSTEYINAKTKLEIECPNNHIIKMCYDSFQQGNRCGICAGNKKLTYDFVKSYIENPEFGGYKLLSTDYINNNSILEIECPFSHRCDKSFSDFKQGRRCMECVGNKKYTLEEVKKIIEKSEYRLISTEYINAQTILEIKCVLGHNCNKTLANFMNGQRCSECYGNKKLTYDFVKSYIENPEFGGFKLLSTEYINSDTKLEIECPLGHKCDKLYSSFRQGNRCSECIGCKKYTYDEVKLFIENPEFGEYKLLSTEYKNVYTKLHIECPKNHLYYVTFSNFKNHYKRCPLCKNKTEAKLLEWLQEKFEVTYQPKYEWCKKERKLPYDFAIEEYKILIELDGDQHFQDFDHWNSDYKEVQANDKFKMRKALQNGYTIIRIYQPDVLNDTIDWKTIIQELITLRDEWCVMYVSSNDIYDDEECDFNFKIAKNDIAELEVDEIINKIDDFHLEEVDNDTKTIKIEDFKNKIANIKSILIKEEKNYICCFKGRVSL